MKKKISSLQTPRSAQVFRSLHKPTVDGALMRLYAPEGTTFTKTQAIELWHSELGITLEKARTIFEKCLQYERIERRSRRFCVPRPVQGWSRGSVSFGRNGEFFFTPAGGKNTTRSNTMRSNLFADDDSILSNLLPGDSIWAKERGGSWSFQGMIARGTKTVVCRVFDPNCGTAFVVGNPANESRVQYRTDDKNPKQGSIIVVKLDDDLCKPMGAPAPITGVVTEVLGDADDPDLEIEIAVNRFGIPHRFSAEALQESEALPDSVPESEVKDRVDLRDIAFVTIDGEDARDFDDAVWCTPHDEGWRLLVAIADVSHYVRPQTALDVEAQHRSTSVYFPRRVVPMLPEKLSNGLCSLNPDVDRCTMVCDMLIGSDGTVYAYQFYPALIHSKARLTYTCVWQALQGDDAELTARGGVPTDIANLHGLYKSLRAARERRGALDFESVETQFVFEPESEEIAAIVRREHNDAHRLIEECMLAANVCAADFIERNKHPCLFRVHDSPPPDRLKKLRELLGGMGLKLGGGDKPTAADYKPVIRALKSQACGDTMQMLLLRSMQQAMYSPVNIGHYGLNYERYTHFTSPIRRYPDLLVHRTIRAILAKTKDVPHVCVGTEEFMQSRSARSLLETNSKPENESSVWAQLGTITSAAERRADDASRDIVSWLKCRYMERFVEKSFTGEITGCVAAGVFVTLKNLFVEGFLHVSKLGNEYFEFDEDKQCFVGSESGRRIGPGKKIKVVVEEVDPEARSITFTRNLPKRFRRFDDFDDYDDFDCDWNRRRYDRGLPLSERVKPPRSSKHRKK